MTMTEWGDTRPVYLRIASALREQIESGVLAPGSPIPSVNALMAEYQVSNSTAQRVIRHLKSAGLVESQHGRGVFVRTTPTRINKSASYVAATPDGQALPYRGRSTQIAVRDEVPDSDVVEALHLADGETAVSRYRVIVDRHSGQPCEIVTSYWRSTLAAGTALAASAPIPGGAHAELERLGVRLGSRAKDLLTAWWPTAHEARTLELPPSTPVVRVFRVAFDVDGQPVEVERGTYGADRYSFEYTVHMND
jgi:GntR family transcriptional regulator